jgi:hypothetical protein
MMAPTRGDVFRINITPPSDSFPWIRVFRHDEGIRGPGREVAGVDATRHLSRDELALQLGREIIEHSKVLSQWLGPQRDSAD